MRSKKGNHQRLRAQIERRNCSRKGWFITVRADLREVMMVEANEEVNLN